MSKSVYWVNTGTKAQDQPVKLPNLITVFAIHQDKGASHVLYGEHIAFGLFVQHSFLRCV